jgi:hypothetical protein
MASYAITTVHRCSARVERDGLARRRATPSKRRCAFARTACPPGLVDKGRTARSSAKLDALFERLETVRAEGQKALAVSQFTSLLAFDGSGPPSDCILTNAGRYFTL